jgi:16S rRNA (cytosine967-C5)-methyltransferase
LSRPSTVATGGTGPRTSLAQQLAQVARCVQSVQAGRSLTDVLPTVPGHLRPGVQALTFHALRCLGTTSALVGALAEQAPPPFTHALLCAALALLRPGAGATPGDNTPVYDAFTVVDQAVDAARAQPATARQAGMVNACLRRYLREAEALHSQVDADWEARYNHPAWWVKRVRRDHPQQWQAILAASQHSAPLVLRVNVTHIPRDAYLARLADEGLSAQAVGLSGVVLEQPVPVEGLPGYAEGWFSVQDTAAQWAAPLVLDGLSAPADRPLRVLDACAAPGGKTAHLLEHAHALGLSIDVLALEVDARRSARISENLQRLRLNGAARVKVADAAQPAAWWDGRPFDAVLLDAPCSASGIVRRHPDVRWLRRESDVPALVDTQRRILESLWPTLAPGGRLVYCTCSVFKAEGQAQVDSFLSRHTGVLGCAAPGHLLPIAAAVGTALPDNPPGGNDGFFYAVLDKLA